MSVLAMNSYGTMLKVGGGGSSETFTTVPEVKEVNAPNVKTDLNDVSSHDSPGNFKEYLPGMHDGDQVTAPIWWKPSNTVHKSLRVDAYASTKRNFKTVFPDDTDNTVAYSGYIVDMQGDAKIGQPLASTLNIKCTGLPAWS